MKTIFKCIQIVTLISITIATQTSAKIIAHWDLNELSGSNIVNDSASGFIASPAGASTPALGLSGAANGTETASKFIDSGYWRSEPNNLLAPTNLTISFWVKGSNVLASAAHGAVVSTRSSGENGTIFYSNKGKLEWWVRNSAGWSAQSVTIDFLTGSNWHHVIGTYNSGTREKRFAVTPAGDTWGGFASVTAGSALWVPSDKRIGIGASPDGTYKAGEVGDFWIDDVQYYDHALSDSAAQYLFENPGKEFHFSDPEIKIASEFLVGDVVKNKPITSTLTVKNTGVSSNLTISASFTAGDAGVFSIDSIPSPIASGGGEGDIVISYKPQITGDHTATLRVICNDQNYPTNYVTVIGTNSKLLLLHWKLDDPQGSPTATDETGLYPGTITGGVELGITNAPSGTAVDLNGTTNFVRAAFTQGLQKGKYTLSMWCKANSTAVGCITDSGPDRTGWRWYYNLYSAERVDLWNYGGPSAWEEHVTNSLPVQVWHHLATTYDRSTRRFSSYINGEPFMSTIQPNEYIIPVNGWFSIGHRSDNNYNGLDGEIDDVQYYATDLTDSDIAWLYENPGRTVIDRDTTGTVLIMF